MRIVFAGTPEYAVPTLRALLAAGHEVAGVITRPDAPQGRKRQLVASPVAQVAASYGLEVHKTNRPGADTSAWLRTLRAQLGVVVAYGALLPAGLLEALQLGWINLHFSALPKWRGAAPVQRALLAGENTLGLSVFRLVNELDAGPYLAGAEHTVAPGTTAGAALTQLAELGTAQVLEAISILTADPHAGSAQQGESSYAHKLQRTDGHLRCEAAAAAVLAQWAGVTPEPGAYALAAGVPLKVLEMRAACQPAQLESEPPGTALLVGQQVFLALQTGSVELVRVQPAGKPPMAAAAWLRGRGGRVMLR